MMMMEEEEELQQGSRVERCGPLGLLLPGLEALHCCFTSWAAMAQTVSGHPRLLSLHAEVKKGGELVDGAAASSSAGPTALQLPPFHAPELRELLAVGEGAPLQVALLVGQGGCPQLHLLSMVPSEPGSYAW
jgi:hypothetical protein